MFYIFNVIEFTQDSLNEHNIVPITSAVDQSLRSLFILHGGSLLQTKCAKIMERIFSCASLYIGYEGNYLNSPEYQQIASNWLKASMDVFCNLTDYSDVSKVEQQLSSKISAIEVLCSLLAYSNGAFREFTSDLLINIHKELLAALVDSDDIQESIGSDNYSVPNFISKIFDLLTKLGRYQLIASNDAPELPLMIFSKLVALAHAAEPLLSYWQEDPDHYVCEELFFSSLQLNLRFLILEFFKVRCCHNTLLKFRIF